MAGLVAAGGLGLHWQTDGAPLWWLLNREPPVVQAVAPVGPQRGLLSVEVAVHPRGRAALEGAWLDGQRLALPPAPPASDGGGHPAPSAQAVAIDTSRLTDGHHVLRLEAVDRSWRRNRADQELVFTSDNTPPRLTVEASTTRLRAGQPALVRWAADEVAEVHATWGSESVPALPPAGGPAPPPTPVDTRGPGGLSAPGAPNGRGTPAAVTAGAGVIAVPVQAQAGEVALHLNGRDQAGNTSEATLPLLVESAPLPRQALLVPEHLAGLATAAVAQAEAAQVAALTGTVRPERLWKGPFRAPLPAGFPRTTGFGERRDYADGHVVYHAGHDLAAPQGTAVLAAADGVVIFAAPLPQRGHTVIVDHGAGVFTLYAHLLHLQVESGQAVSAGHTVGQVGSTGLSTGPHLHWEVRLRGVAVDPVAWLDLTQTLP